MIRKRIWSELTQTKHDIEYVRLYSRFQVTLQKWINITILVCSGSGIVGWIADHPNYAVLACIITGGISLIKLIAPFFIMSDQDLKKLNDYYSKQCNYFLELEKLWFEFEDGKNKSSSMSNRFYELVKKGNELHHEYSDLDITHFRRMSKFARNHSIDYFKLSF